MKRITCHSVEDQKNALREIEISKLVNHEHVIHVVDSMIVGMADIVLNATSQVYIVLPYYKNGSLQDYLNVRAKTKDHMPEDHALQMFLGICEGVKAFHEVQPNPLAHRDLKTGT